MIVVFLLGLLVSSLMERRAEVVSVFNNKRTVFEDSIVAQNEKFKADYPREYETWAMTEDTTFKSKYNSSQEVDVLEQRPEMVVLWAGYAFSRHYNTPRGHKHALEDMRKILRTGNAQDSAHRQSRHSDYARLHCRRHATGDVLDV